MSETRTLLELQMYNLSLIDIEVKNELEEKSIDFLSSYDCENVNKAVEAITSKLCNTPKNTDLDIYFEYYDDECEDYMLSQLAIVYALACECSQSSKEYIFEDVCVEDGSDDDMYIKEFYKELYIIKYAVDEALGLV